MSQSYQGKRDISPGPCPPDEFSGRFDERKMLLEVLQRATDHGQAIDHGQLVIVSGRRGSGKSSFLNWAEYVILNGKDGSDSPAIKKDFYETTGMVFTTCRELLTNLKEHQKFGWFRKLLDDPSIRKSIDAALDVLEKLSSLTGPYGIAINAGVAPAKRLVSEETFDYSDLLSSFLRIFRGLSKVLIEENRFLAILLDDVQWSSEPDFLFIKDLIRSLPANIVLIIAFRMETDSEKKYTEMKNELYRFSYTELKLGGMINKEIKEFAAQRYNLPIDDPTADFLSLNIGDPICLVGCFNLLQERELEPNLENFRDIYLSALDPARCIYTGLDSRWQDRVNSLCILYPPLKLAVISCMLKEQDLIRLKEELDQSFVFKKLETELYDFAYPSLREYRRKELPRSTIKKLSSQAAKCLKRRLR
jgi:energy-coupling factor transporter ATP-binding protein EcfA2